MYNKDFKERFLAEGGIAESTAKTYRFFLERASKTEEYLEKDIYALTPYECDQLILSFSRKSKAMAAVIIACFKRYIDFCIDNKQVKDYFNYFSTISGTDDLEKYVDKTAQNNKYITFEGLLEIQKILKNEQDIALVELLFCGVNGREASELINLRNDDILPDRILLSNRDIPITDRTYQIIQDAINQKEYWRNNGEMEDTKTGASRVINHSDYVLRPTGSTKQGAIGYAALQMRLNKIKEFFGNDYLNLTNIWHSGMIYHLVNIKAEKGEVTSDDYRKINKLFGYGEQYWYQSKIRFEPFL